MRKGKEVVHASKKTGGTDEWRTPPSFLELVRIVFQGPIDLDPCTTKDNPTLAAGICTKEVIDGLLVPWFDRFDGTGLVKTVFLNPPYSNVRKWMQKAVEETRRVVDRDTFDPTFGGHELIALVPARTDTQFFHQYAIHATRLCFWRGRIRFEIPGKASMGAPFPSLVLYWGDRPGRFDSVFKHHGLVFDGLDR